MERQRSTSLVALKSVISRGAVFIGAIVAVFFLTRDSDSIGDQPSSLRGVASSSSAHSSGTVQRLTEYKMSGRQTAHVFTHKGVRMNYLLYLPESTNRSEAVPLLVFLHGAGESGTQVMDLKIQGPPRIVEAEPQGTLATHFAVLSPQSPRAAFSSEIESKCVTELTQTILRKYAHPKGQGQEAGGHVFLDPSRVYLTGLSMGGYGTFAIGARPLPQLWAAIAPVCGGGDPGFASVYKHYKTPVWVFHGRNDVVIPFQESEVGLGCGGCLSPSHFFV
jgi:predicted peptidase